MPLKVCQLCAVDFTLRHFLTALIDGMRAEGWSVTAVCSDGPFVPALRSAGYAIETVPISRGLNPVRHMASLVRLARLLRRERFDILHVHTPIAALLGRIAARLTGVPMVVYTAHGFYFHDDMHPLPKAIYTWLEWLGGRLTNLLFTQSEEDARTAVAKRFLPAARVVPIGNGVDVSSFDPARVTTRAATRLKLGVPQEAVAIGMIGRMVAEKGFAEFLDAAETVVAQGFPVYFLAIGERLPSDHAAGTEDRIRTAKARLGDRLVLTGLRSDVPDLLAAMDIFTLPSYREGMPRTIIEAMLMAKPVVATDIRGSREEVVAGETGILVPVRDASALSQAFITLASDPAMRQRMGEAGRMRALALYDESVVVAKQVAALRAHLPDSLKARA